MKTANINLATALVIEGFRVDDTEIFFTPDGKRRAMYVFNDSPTLAVALNRFERDEIVASVNVTIRKLRMVKFLANKENVSNQDSV